MTPLKKFQQIIDFYGVPFLRTDVNNNSVFTVYTFIDELETLDCVKSEVTKFHKTWPGCSITYKTNVFPDDFNDDRYYMLKIKVKKELFNNNDIKRIRKFLEKCNSKMKQFYFNKTEQIM